MIYAVTLPDAHSCLLREILNLVVRIVLRLQLFKIRNLKLSIVPNYVIVSLATSCNGCHKTGAFLTLGNGSLLSMS